MVERLPVLLWSLFTTQRSQVVHANRRDPKKKKKHRASRNIGNRCGEVKEEKVFSLSFWFEAVTPYINISPNNLLFSGTLNKLRFDLCITLYDNFEKNYHFSVL